MKRIFIILLITLFSTAAFSQMRSGRSMGSLKINWHKTGWFIDGNAGIRLLGQTSNLATTDLAWSGNAGLGYFFNKKIAIKGRLDYNQFNASYGASNVVDRSGSAAASLEVMVRLLELISPNNYRKFELNIHAGSGLTAIYNPSLKREIEANGGEYKGKLFNADNLGHIIVGLTPQYHLNSRLSLNLDVSQFTQFKQFNTYDSHNGVKSKDVTGFVAISAGLTFRFL
ncbi:hypothetical protein ERX46_13310 [Brumimicrobium glaciale]|uniref:Outer membrane protein beta-barrel domain-containing protein n=1 Tax=Brumimicrobium glaciale TaxID=200475 RepID=A0A4Q4KI91_9FLAO|nr:hypothetical protein [Brumimicrobium glaciale]RYM33023.1 hypothetical protein ERX46_13310 [Brumimicrobium glaciale]